jgi:hypothetical protein
MPPRRDQTKSSHVYPSSSILTGNRWTILMKLPVAFWGSNNANVDPVPIENLINAVPHFATS